MVFGPESLLKLTILQFGERKSHFLFFVELDFRQKNFHAFLYLDRNNGENRGCFLNTDSTIKTFSKCSGLMNFLATGGA